MGPVGNQATYQSAWLFSDEEKPDCRTWEIPEGYIYGTRNGHDGMDTGTGIGIGIGIGMGSGSGSREDWKGSGRNLCFQTLPLIGDWGKMS